MVSIECMSRCMQRAGLELMDMMAVYQEGAYERLCRYIYLFLSKKICW